MSSPSPTPSPTPAIEEYAAALARGIEAALPGWVERSVARVVGGSPPPVAAAARAAGEHAALEVGPLVRALLEADIDDQHTTPLAILRAAAVLYPTAVLATAGVPPVTRDRFAMDAFPGDVYDLAPASLADLDESLAEPGIAWGAAKAFEHQRRHLR